jgi:uncharacterized protein (TIGR03435 family)
MPLQMIIASTYDVAFQSSRLTGGQEDILSDRDDIDAMAEKGAVPETLSPKARNERVTAMMKNMLADRFQLKLHREDKEMPVYVITVAKDGPKLKPAGFDLSECGDQEQAGRDCSGMKGGGGPRPQRGPPLSKTWRCSCRIGPTVRCSTAPA